MQVNVLRQILYNIAKKRAEEKPREYTSEVFHASEIGGCPRSLFFKRMGIEARPPFPPNYFRMEDGTWLHRRLQKDLKDAGILIEKEKLLREKLLGLQGHFDGVVSIEALVNGERVLLEIKSVNKDKFEKICLLGKATKANFKQANFYAIKKGVKYILFFYYCADNAKTVEFLEEVSTSIYAETIETIKMLKGCIKTETVPEACNLDECYFCAYSWCCMRGAKKCLVL